MYKERENLLYYLTIMNETYLQPAIPDRKGIREGILKGIYHLKSTNIKRASAHANLLGSGAILNCAIEAQKILEDKYDIAADVWSVTSYKELYHDAIMTERWNRLNPDKKAKNPYIRQALKNTKGVFVAATDYVKTLPESIARWLPGPLVSLGTDGFGRSDTREKLRAFFEIDGRHIAVSALYALAREGSIKPETVKKAMKDLDIDPEKANPMIA
jgi:pyruvate dehydrogenase E1 component